MDAVHLAKAVALRHELHANPSLSLEETPTKNRLMAFLRTNTMLEIVDRGAWFTALYRAAEDAETIAFRCEMDALPIPEDDALPYASRVEGVSHRCGHDGHMAAMALLAMEIDRSGADRNIYFIFQHGEEIGAGGQDCAPLLREAGVSRVYAFHNWSGYPERSVVLIHGVTQCASMGYIVNLHGCPAHAGQPGDGANPAPALAKLILALPEILSLGDYRGDVWQTVVGLGAGGKNFGLAAADGYLALTLRAVYDEDLALLQSRVRERACALCVEYGLTMDEEEQDVFPSTANDEHEVQRVKAAAEALGLTVLEKDEPILPSEDFGHFLKVCPGALFYMGNGEDYPAIHTVGYDFPDAILSTAVELLLKLAQE